MKFSERYGYKVQAPMLEEHDLPSGLRNQIWNSIWMNHLNNGRIYNRSSFYSPTFSKLSMHLRKSYFKATIDDRPTSPNGELKFIRQHYFQLQFPEFYDFLEMMAGDSVKSIYTQGYGIADQFVEQCNKVLEQEKACFRFVSNLVTPITSEEEMAEVEKAAATNESGHHIQRAIELYRDRTSPDYRNSVKESISAVEATYRGLTGKKHSKIGTAVAEMEKEGMHLPTSLKNGFAAIYGWTSGKDGIRHALTKDARPVTEAEARLMLVMCSAYVNYLLSLRGK